MSDTFHPGELFVYTNENRWELGMVKQPNNTGDGYFCWYSRGDTAANTPTCHMHKLANAGFTYIEQLLDNAISSDAQAITENAKLRDDVERMFKANVEKNGEIVKLLDENIKMRELVRDMWFWHYEGHIDNESQERQMKHIDGVLDRMRELGIEVDE